MNGAVGLRWRFWPEPLPKDEVFDYLEQGFIDIRYVQEATGFFHLSVKR